MPRRSAGVDLPGIVGLAFGAGLAWLWISSGWEAVSQSISDPMWRFLLWPAGAMGGFLIGGGLAFLLRSLFRR